MSKQKLHFAHELCWHQLNGEINPVKHLTAMSSAVWQGSTSFGTKKGEEYICYSLTGVLSVQKVKRSVI
jgi:hypothetical protein